MAATPSSTSWEFKTLYPEGVDNEFFEEGKPLMQAAEHSKDFTNPDVNGGIKIPLALSNAQGIGSSAPVAFANETPSAGTFITVRQRRHIAGGTLDAQLVHNAKAAKAANVFVQTVRHEVDSLSESLSAEINQRMYGDASGIRSFVGAGTITGTNLPLVNVADLNFYFVGMKLQFVDPVALTVRTGSVRVTGKNFSSSAPSLTVDVALNTTGIVAGDGIVRESMANVDFDGLKAHTPATIASNDNFNGLNRFADRSRLAGFYFDATGLDIRVALIDAMAVAQTYNSHALNSSNSYALVHPTQIAALQGKLEMSVVKEMSYNSRYEIGGIKGFSFNGFNLLPDNACPVDEIYIVGKGAFIRGTAGNQPTIETNGTPDGGMVANLRTGVIDFSLVHYGNTYSPTPWKLGRIKISPVSLGA